MPVLFTATVFQLVLCFAVLAVMIAVAIYVLGLFRVHSLQNEPTADELLNNLEELKTQGKLSDEEYRNIKKKLSEHILYEKNAPCPDLHPGTVDPAAMLLQKVSQSGDPDDTKIFGKDEGGTDTVINFEKK